MYFNDLVQRPQAKAAVNATNSKDHTIQYGYIIEAAILYYPIRNGWKLWYGINGLFYYKSIQD